jgi:hypothetical protein
MASYSVNTRGVAHARELIDKRQYVLSSAWGDVQPDAAAETAYLESHSWDEYSAWHLGLTRVRTMGRRPAMPSSTATFAASTGWA